MRITTIPRIYRNLRRWREIIAVLRRYGLADWLSRLQVDFLRELIKDDSGTPLSHYTRPTRVRLAMMELGPTFVKLGQILSLRPDLVGLQLANELQSLQTQTTADPFEAVQATLRSELRSDPLTLFKSIAAEPIASASIGQVHEAVLADGTPVVIKVQHANIRNKVDEDLTILAGLASWANLLPDLAIWQPEVMVSQLARTIRGELSFERELRNLQLFEKEYAANRSLVIPHAYPQLSGDRMLTLQRIGGTSLQEMIDRRAAGGDGLAGDRASGRIAEQLTRLYIDMIFRLGVYHADPHPGNIRVLEGGKLALLDFGMVGRIDERLRETFEEMLLAIVTGDSRWLMILVKRAGRVPPSIDEGALSADIAEFVGVWGSQPLERFDLTGALGEITELMHRHHIVLPTPAGMLLKTLITLEGTLRRLEPPFSLMEMLRPALRGVQLRRMSPLRQAKKMRRMYVEFEELFERLPSQINRVMDQLQRGEMDVRLSHRGLAPSINRLVLGMLASSLMLASAVLMAYKVPPVLFTEPAYGGVKELSVIGALGMILSLLISFRLLFAINRSGHLNPHDRDDAPRGE